MLWGGLVQYRDNDATEFGGLFQAQCDAVVGSRIRPETFRALAVEKAKICRLGQLAISLHNLFNWLGKDTGRGLAMEILASADHIKGYPLDVGHRRKWPQSSTPGNRHW